MVANLRCTELKDEAIIKIQAPLGSFLEQAESKLLTTDIFNRTSEKIRVESLSHYDEYAKQYDEKVYIKIRKDLE